MDRLDFRQREIAAVAPGKEQRAGALVRGASVVVLNRAEEIGEAERGPVAGVADEFGHDDRSAERPRRVHGRQRPRFGYDERLRRPD